MTTTSSSNSSGSSSSIFHETLKKAALEHYHGNLTAFGIDSLQSLVLLTMQDYAVVGVSSMDDRKSMFSSFAFHGTY
jgi:hypothetical protein